MIRNMKALGLALVAMLAMSAVVASAASAEATSAKFTAQDNTYPKSFTGTNSSGSEVFTTEGGSVECDSHFSGSAGEASSTVTAHPTYSNCVAFGFLEATVTTTGCDYQFHITTKTGADSYQGTADVVCSGSNTIKIVAATCSAEVKGQTGLSKVNFTNMTGTTNDITVVADVDNQIDYTVTKDGFLCPFGGTGNKTDGSYNTGTATTIQATGGIHVG